MRYLDLPIVCVPLLWAAFASLSATTAHAFPVTACGTTCNSDCELAANLVCDPSQTAVTLGNGADLDMRGFDIRCTIDEMDPLASTEGPCGTGVRITGANSVVYSSASQDPSDPTPRVSAPWRHAIDCSGSSNARISGISISQAVRGAGSADKPAIRYCAIVEDNIIIGRPVITQPDPDHWDYRYPSLAILIANGTRVSGNYIDGFATGVYRQSGTSFLTIEDNVINYRDLTGTDQSYAIDVLRLSGSSPGTISNNVVVGDGRSTVLRVNAGDSTAGNTCRKGVLRCADCIAGLHCDASTPCVSP